ncbi:MAG: EAL domain-containing protein [Ferrovum sp.]|jgi:EAL domain-containing protein (putative c-di-GMP-specific phosphodiesterase class I)|nr:EAL domain-containing protein [Ferrovum sp.]
MISHLSTPFESVGCNDCRNSSLLDFDFIMAFQPILDLRSGKPYAYEALVRGTQGESAYSILSKVDDHNRYRFDQACRVRAIQQAAALGLTELPNCHLSINFLPKAVYRPEVCIRATLEACEEFQFPGPQLIFEVSESEDTGDSTHLVSIFKEYQRQGFLTAIDDFGAGYAGLNLLAKFQPDILKIDMELIRGIHENGPKQAILKGVLTASREMGIEVIAEGIESPMERDHLMDLGVYLQQGFLFARPLVNELPLNEVNL